MVLWVVLSAVATVVVTVALEDVVVAVTLESVDPVLGLVVELLEVVRELLPAGTDVVVVFPVSVVVETSVVFAVEVVFESVVFEAVAVVVVAVVTVFDK